jgi:tripartite-type tricarboxylate transporter receptor subunit TctC
VLGCVSLVIRTITVIVAICGTCADLSELVRGLHRAVATLDRSITMRLREKTFSAFVAAAFVVLGGMAGLAAAEDYPVRPITMIVPFPAGGPTDAIGRVIAEGMRPSLGRPVIVENIGGAGGSLGTERVAFARPDGYTLGLGNTVTHVYNGAVFQLKYDVVNDFEPVGLLVNETAIIVVRKDLPVNNLGELIAWLKAKPGNALVGTAGVSTQSDLVPVFFERATGTNMQHVPYRGLAAAITALMAGEIDVVMGLPANTLPQVRTGTVKAIAVTAKTRMPGAPDIPTADEGGLHGFVQTNWHALFVPKSTPSDIVGKLNAAAVAALADPPTREKLINLGQAIFPAGQLTPAALAAFQKSEIEQRWPIIKAAGIKAE